VGDIYQTVTEGTWSTWLTEQIIQHPAIAYFWNSWSLIQLGMLLVLFLLARLADRQLEPRMETYLRGVSEHPRVMRLLLLLLRRLEWLIFLGLVWLVYAVMQEVTWPSRSYLLGNACYLIIAWMAISISSRQIQNRLLARTLALFVFAVTALQFLGLMDRATVILDSAALQLGDFRLSLLLVIQALVALFVLTSIAVMVSRLVERRIRESDDLTPAMSELVIKLMRPTLMVLAFVAALQAVNVDLSALALFSGALGLGIGFGLQKGVSNLISGIILLLDKSIKPGDVISLGQTFGWITELGARYVAVRTREGHTHLIPNEDLITQEVVNWTHSSELTRLELTFKVSYESDPHEIRRIAREAARLPERVVGDPQPLCHLLAFGESSLDFILRFWIVDPSNGVINIKGEVLLAVWDALKEAGVNVPLPHRRLVLDQPVDIRLGGAAARSGD
jgi:small-conductance mechanosensitive channel